MIQWYHVCFPKYIKALRWAWSRICSLSRANLVLDWSKRWQLNLSVKLMLDLEMYLFYIFNFSWSSIAATKWNTAVTKIHLLLKASLARKIKHLSPLILLKLNKHFALTWSRFLLSGVSCLIWLRLIVVSSWKKVLVGRNIVIGFAPFLWQWRP